MTEVTNNKTFGKKMIQSLSRAVDNAVLLLLLVCLIFAGYSLWDTHKVYEDASSAKYETYKPVSEEETKSFEELRAMNPDVLGWITIYDTMIDYPLVQSKVSNNEYLSRNPEKEFESSGSIYLDTHNSPDFSDFNSVIHGHHMDERKMFGDLELFTDQHFFNTHQYGDLFYNGKNHGIEFFAVLKVDAHTSIIQSPGITDETQKQIYINDILSRALYTRDVGISSLDHIVILSTCAMDMTNGRFILCAKLHEEAVADPFPNDEKKSSILKRIDVFGLVDRFQDRPIWQWLLILVFVILIVWVLYRLELRRIKRKNERKLEATNDEEGEKS